MLYVPTTDISGIETLLDLNEVNLFGFQKHVFNTLIESILLGIEKNDEFPPVFVTTLNNKDFFLTYVFNPYLREFDGGHHRAKAHYLAKKPLKCKIIPFEFKAKNCTIHLEKIKIIKDTNKEFYYYHKNKCFYR